MHMHFIQYCVSSCFEQFYWNLEPYSSGAKISHKRCLQQPAEMLRSAFDFWVAMDAEVPAPRQTRQKPYVSLF